MEGPTLSELQGQPQPPLPKQRSALARIGYALAAYFLFRVVIGGIMGVRNAGHTQADVEKHIADWKAAGAKYLASADCGALKGDACQDHWRTVVAPNLKASEAAWAVIENDFAYEVAHRSVPDSCRVAYANMQAAVNEFYPVEDKLVSLVVNQADPASIKELVPIEDAAHKKATDLGLIDARGCKDY